MKYKVVYWVSYTYMVILSQFNNPIVLMLYQRSKLGSQLLQLNQFQISGSGRHKTMPIKSKSWHFKAIRLLIPLKSIVAVLESKMEQEKVIRKRPLFLRTMIVPPSFLQSYHKSHYMTAVRRYNRCEWKGVQSILIQKCIKITFKE